MKFFRVYLNYNLINQKSKILAYIVYIYKLKLNSFPKLNCL